MKQKQRKTNGLAYYNEWDKDTAKWLRELIRCGLTAPGVVDRRDICDIKADEIRDYTQVHLFAGIGGWSYALRLAGWPDDLPVWTGSCPCQPFSIAGKGEGHEDERHLWPEMFQLARQCRPDILFGEQVEGAIGHGWLDGVFTDLEEEGYACGSLVLGAHSVGAPHIRQRCYWVADSASSRRIGKVQGPEGETRDQARVFVPRQQCEIGGMGNALSTGREGYGRPGQESIPQNGQGAERHGSASGFWDDYEVVPFRDGKFRRIKSGLKPLAHGVPARVVKLCGAGNALVVQVAAEFVRTYLDVLRDAL